MQSSIHIRLAFIDPSTDRSEDPLDHGPQLDIVVKSYVGFFKKPFFFDIDLLGTVDHDLGNFLIVEQGLQGAQAKSDIKSFSYPFLPDHSVGNVHFLYQAVQYFSGLRFQLGLDFIIGLFGQVSV